MVADQIGGLAAASPESGYDSDDIIPVSSLTDAHFRILLNHFRLNPTHSSSTAEMINLLKICSPIAQHFPNEDPASLKIVFGKSESLDNFVENICDCSDTVWLYPKDPTSTCTSCKYNVDESNGRYGQGLQCDLCGLWFHNQCLRKPCSKGLLDNLSDSPPNLKLFCPPCMGNVPSFNTAVKFIVESATKITELMNSVEDVKSALDTSVGANQSMDCTNTDTVDVLTGGMSSSLDLVNENLMRGFRELKDTLAIDIKAAVGEMSDLSSSVDGTKASLERDTDTGSNSEISVPPRYYSPESSQVTESIGELNDAITTASNHIKELGESVRTNTGSYNSALETVVTKVNQLDNIDIKALSSKFSLTVNEIHSKLNQDVLKPSTIETLANKLIESRVNNIEEPACSGECVAAIQTKMEEINSVTSNSFESNGQPEPSSEQNWTRAVTSRRQHIAGGNLTSSPNRTTPAQQVAPQHPPVPRHDLCNKVTTVVIDNVKSRDLIKHGSVIKQNFNKLHPSMKIKSCFCTSKGSVFIELMTETDANSVVTAWKGTNFGGNDASATSAVLLINKGAQGLIKVPLDYTDANIDSALSKDYAGAKARRFVNKNKERLYSVLIAFRDYTQFQDACEKGVEIENSFYDVTKFVQRKSITRCYRCLRFDHPAKWCTKKQVCKHCTEDHLASQCPDPTKKKCINCNSDQHSSLDLSCPTFTQKKAIIDRLNHD